MYTYSYHEISPNDLTATDLREALDAAYEEYGVTTDAPSYAPIAAYRIDVDGHAEHAQALMIAASRVGIAWGGDADWADYDDIDQAICDYFNEYDKFAARN